MRQTRRGRRLRAALLLLLPYCQAGESRWRKIYRFSVAAVVAGSVADVATSMGKP